MKKLLPVLFLCCNMVCVAQEKNHHLEISKNMEILTSVYNSLDMMYVDSIDAHTLITRGITAMLSSLDPYTEFYPEEDLNDYKFMLTGKYAGIGALIHQNLQLNYVVIDQTYANMPAAKAGLRYGDIILSIDDESMEGKSTSYVSDHLRGDAGTSFILKVKRPTTGKTMKFNIMRETIKTPAVTYYGMRNEHTGYINLNGFSDDCAKEVRHAIIDLRTKGMKKLILDLRGNGGGSEKEAVDIVNMLVPKGRLVVQNKGKVERANREYFTTQEPIDTLMPVVVLVNGGSASASEITAGALQDMDRAVILGEKTYGKGLVQVTLDMPHNTAAKITTYKYYIPSGRCIQAYNYKKDGSSSYTTVADSLKKTFHTNNGRIVKDGGGIQPDVVCKADSMTNIVYYLTQLRDSNEVVMNYILNYIQQHPTIAPAGKFELTDEDFNTFKQQVLSSNFKYDRETERYLKQLEELARFEGYYNDAKEEFDALKKKLTHDTERDLDFNKERILMYLEPHIASIYYYDAGGVENMLRRDKQLKEAEKLLDNPDEYNRILTTIE